MSKFFIKRGEKIRGPISLEKIQQLADAGKLRETDLVGRNETGVFTAVTHYFEIRTDPASEIVDSSTAEPAPTTPDSPTRVAGQVSPKTITHASRVQPPDISAHASHQIPATPQPTVNPVTNPRVSSPPVATPISGTAPSQKLWVIGGIISGAFAIGVIGLLIMYSGVFTTSERRTAVAEKSKSEDLTDRQPKTTSAPSAPKYSFVVPEAIERLPANFKSFTLPELVQELKEQVPTREKGEFEKTTDWIESQKNLWSSAKLFNQPANGRFIYCYSKKFFNFNYDPDSELTTVKLTDPDEGKADGDVWTSWTFMNFPKSEWKELTWKTEPAAAKEQAANLGIAIVFRMGLPVQRQLPNVETHFSPLMESRSLFRSILDGRANVGVEKTVWISELSEVLAYSNDTGAIIARRDLGAERSTKRSFSDNTDGLFGKLAISPDSSLIASSHQEGCLEIADVESGRILKYLEGHKGNVQGLDFHPDNQRLATCATDNTAKIWDVSTGEIVQELAGHEDEIDSVKFSHDGKLVATGGDEGIVRIYEVASGNLLKSMTTHRTVDFGGLGSSRTQDRYQAIQEIAFSPDDRLIATVGYSDDPVVVFDMTNGQKLGAFAADKDNTNSVIFSPDGRYISTAGRDGDVYVWDTLALTQGPTVEGLWQKVPADVQPDGWSSYATRCTKDRLNWLERLAGDSDFDLSDVTKAAGRARTMEAAGELESVRFSSDGKLLAALGKTTIYLYDFATGEKIKEHDLGFYTMGQDIQFSPDGKWLAVKTTRNGTIFHLETFLQSDE